MLSGKLASVSPGIFEPVKLGLDNYVDGGVRTTAPIGAALRNRYLAYRSWPSEICRNEWLLSGTMPPMADKIEQPTDLWDLEHYLTESRKKIDRKYDYRYSVLTEVGPTAAPE